MFSVPVWYLLLSLAAGYLVKNKSGGLGDILNLLKNLFRPSTPTPSPVPGPLPVPAPDFSLVDLLKALLSRLKVQQEELNQTKGLVREIQTVTEKS